MGPGALEFALALYQSPSLAAATRRRALPDDLFEVIRIAAGDTEGTQAALARSGATATVVREASQLYLETVLFDPEADHYRVLGVAPGADESQMREHRRWLLKWLHPDRGDDWDAVYAARVQQAWQQLRDPERRAGYDEALGDPDEWAPEASGPPLRPVWTARALPREESPTPVRHTGAWVAIAALPLFLIGQAWIFWPGGGSSRPGSADGPASTLPRHDFYVLERVPLPAAAPSDVTEGTVETPERIVQADAPVTASVEVPAPAGELAPSAAPAPPSRSQPTSAELAASSTVPEAASSAHPMPPAVPAYAPQPARIDAAAVETAMAAFQNAYERGDIEALMAVFTPDARNRRGGREAIRQDYQRLFRSSRQRRLQWHSLEWQRGPDHALGEGGFVASITPRRGTPNTVRGQVRVEVVQQGREVRIRELWHEDHAP